MLSEAMLCVYQDPFAPFQVRHFQASDQILSHLAVKTVSTCIIYHLQESVSPQMSLLQEFTEENFGLSLVSNST